MSYSSPGSSSQAAYDWACSYLSWRMSRAIANSPTFKLNSGAISFSLLRDGDRCPLSHLLHTDLSTPRVFVNFARLYEVISKNESIASWLRLIFSEFSITFVLNIVDIVATISDNRGKLQEVSQNGKTSLLTTGRLQCLSNIIPLHRGRLYS